MPFDALTMAAVTDDLREHVVGGRIQKIIQPSEYSIGLAIYESGRQHWLLLSADPSSARVHLADGRLAKGFPTPSSFVMLLRKYLEGARLLEVVQEPYERVLVLRSPRANLTVEIMGKHSNVILVGEEGLIFGALKLLSYRESRVRPILPGLRYEAPPEQGRHPGLFGPGPRLDPSRDDEAFIAAVNSAPPDTPLRDTLLGLLAGCGPFLASEIAVRAGAGSDQPRDGVGTETLLLAAQSLYDLLESRRWEPSTFVDSRGRRDFAPYRPASVADDEPAPSMSAAIEWALEGTESRDPLAAVRATVLADVERRRRAAERRVHSLYQGLEAAEEANEVMQAGQLVLAYQYLVQPGESVLVIPDLEITIPLDPRNSPAENAEKLFRRYRKLRDAQRRLPDLIASAEAEHEHVREMASFVRLAESEADLRSLEAEIRPNGESATRTRNKRRGPPRFALGPYVATVGRSARENEEVTFRIGGRDDTWLHARERTGAHVVLRGPGAEPPDDVLQAAAALAAHFSEGRSDTRVDVDATLVRNVRKIPGGPPGRVTYRNFRTLTVAPGLDAWKQVK